MKTFKDLIIKNNSQTELEDILNKVILSSPPEWIFLEELASDYSKNVSKPKEQISCFESPEINGVKGYVWFVIWENELKVNNIVPTKSGSLSFDEYNGILDEFYEKCIKPITIGADSSLTISEGKFNIEIIAGTTVFESLKKWEKSCNHSTGNTHPMDFERWANFLCISFKEKSKLTPDLLQRWLFEACDWNDDELVSKIVIDYEYGISILEHYVNN
ncbi:hypothetical protein ESY86_18555 [Subsaximicrobium wynnwilliamsii]|uniref:Uncharacterized protein n=1 Tax=Subsaximicrobium wynnwilliamsii TaxID=291179 RepID=A0A5C6ZCX9_9FLAO|nr:hypothetical protein [Subsaximicrobium wynnwilliamsii]TXD81177.1 hypothetical protein ESY87_19055 [Subsaximicrobium wynnwilliamsii]TXD86994.1 hypothetical protein ESY86_18555 [Subsaximicrobium wynnwilliamsii]TXE00647.1 hypothetical protein ESY88_18855 [Subsaximicrobium wynnwilliamsii]